MSPPFGMWTFITYCTISTWLVWVQIGYSQLNLLGPLMSCNWQCCSSVFCLKRGALVSDAQKLSKQNHNREGRVCHRFSYILQCKDITPSSVLCLNQLLIWWEVLKQEYQHTDIQWGSVSPTIHMQARKIFSFLSGEPERQERQCNMPSLERWPNMTSAVLSKVMFSCPWLRTLLVGGMRWLWRCSSDWGNKWPGRWARRKRRQSGSSGRGWGSCWCGTMLPC